MAIKYIEKFPTADEFNSLTKAVGWGTRDRNVVEEAFKHSLYAISAYDDDKFIGFGRILGDKTIFVHIHSIMVSPDYQGKQIGTVIITKILEQIEEYRKVNPYIRAYLGASKGKEGFYEKFGFVSRPNDDLGPGMVLYKKD